MNKRIKIIGLILVIIILYYSLQYASTAVHYNCEIIKDDCVPPIYLTSEIIYRTMVQPRWLDKFEIDPMMFFFKDGRFSFWEGQVIDKTVVIRVREDESPVMRWIDEGLPLGVAIHPADGLQIKHWFKNHPEFDFNE